MCEPTTIMLAVSAISAAASAYSQKRAGEAQAEITQQQYEERSEQMSDAANAEMSLKARQARKERERMRVLTGEAGVSGNSFEAMLGDSLQQQDMGFANMRTNARNQQQALHTQTRSKMAGIQIPTALGAGLQIGMAGAQGYLQGSQIEAAGRAPTGG